MTAASLAALLLAINVPSITPGAVITVGDVEPPPGLKRLTIPSLLTRLGWREAPGPDTASRDELDRAERATSAYWEGHIEAAEATLSRLWVGLEGRHLGGRDRDRILAGLWLLAQHYAETERPALARRVCRTTLRLAPTARPRMGHFSGVLRELYAEVARHYESGRQRLVVMAQAGCRVLVDGVDQGPTRTAIGPFEPGTAVLSVRCGALESPKVVVTLNASAKPLRVERLEHRVMLREVALGATPETAETLARALLDAGVPWVLILRPAAGGLRIRLSRKGASPYEPRPMRPSEVSGAVAAQLNVRAPTGRPAQISPAGWALTGSGLGALALAGLFTGLHTVAIDETNRGERNRITESRIYIGTAVGLYVVGAVLTTVGLLHRRPVLGAASSPGAAAFHLPAGSRGRASLFAP